jgi:hypothetical protein
MAKIKEEILCIKPIWWKTRYIILFIGISHYIASDTLNTRMTSRGEFNRETRAEEVVATFSEQIRDKTSTQNQNL